MTDPPYLFDARSAGWQRTTGWERYARELAHRLRHDPDVRVRVAGTSRMTSRFWQDLVAVPVAGRRARVLHFPTFPPVPWASRKAVVVYTLHDLTWWLWRETSSSLGRHYYARLAQRAAEHVHLVTDTEAVADEVRDHFGIDQSRVTSVPLGASLPAPSGRSLRHRPYLLAVGTVEPRKNLLALAEAFERSGIPSTHDLIVVGRHGWGELPDGVAVVSGLDDKAVADMYAGATALVLPSLYEGFGLPAVEAMQLGTPVVCSDLPVLREVTGGHATYVDPGNRDAWVDALRSVVDRPSSSSSSSSDTVRSWSCATYSWDVTAATLSALYRRLDAAAGHGS